MPRKAAALLLRPMVRTRPTAAVTIVPFTSLSLGAILASGFQSRRGSQLGHQEPMLPPHGARPRHTERQPSSDARA
jgi:hypothetical protein